MAFSHGSKARVLLNGFNASNYVNEVSLEGEADTAEITVLGDEAKSYIPGLRDATVKFSGFFDGNDEDDTLTFSYKLNSLESVITQSTYMVTGDTLGFPAYLVTGFLTSDSVSTAADEAATMEFEMQNNTGMQLGKVLHPLGAHTTTDVSTGSTPVDNTAASDNGLAAVLHVTDVTGTVSPSVAVKIQHSADDSTYADLVTFSTATATTSEYKEVTGTVNQYLKVIWTITGTTPSMTFHVAAKRK